MFGTYLNHKNYNITHSYLIFLKWTVLQLFHWTKKWPKVIFNILANLKHNTAGACVKHGYSKFLFSANKRYKLLDNWWIYLSCDFVHFPRCSALWEYKGGQEDIQNILGKTCRKPPTKKCIKFTSTFYVGLSFVLFNNLKLLHLTRIKFYYISTGITRN